MTHVKIQGKEIKNEEELHKFLKKELNFPDYYGENFDALWDCLRDLFGEEVTIEWFDFSESRKRFGIRFDNLNKAELFVSIFRDAERELMAGKFKLIVHE